VPLHYLGNLLQSLSHARHSLILMESVKFPLQLGEVCDQELEDEVSVELYLLLCATVVSCIIWYYA
jgi:hypothetical protein